MFFFISNMIFGPRSLNFTLFSRKPKISFNQFKYRKSNQIKKIMDPYLFFSALLNGRPTFIELSFNKKLIDIEIDF